MRQRAINRLADNLDEVPTSRLANTAKDIAITEGILIDKHRIVTERPNTIVGHRDAHEILGRLQARWKAVTADIDGTAEDDDG